MSTPTGYPAHLRGRLDPGLSRWKWLVKWLLAIPHVVVLVFLWIAMVVLTIVAGFAILFTGRYPRGIFDFNVGVIRWSWRVGFYAFDVLGTDRYPPWTLRSVPDYPADFTVDYPEHLSRGLVLVKWWLLVLPQYLIISFFSGGWSLGSNGRAGGLIPALVLVAAVILLFTGRYPRSLFDFVMGLHRWAYRVMAYAALLTDVYPPFRYDGGGDDAPDPAPAGPTPPVLPTPATA